MKAILPSLTCLLVCAVAPPSAAQAPGTPLGSPPSQHASTASPAPAGADLLRHVQRTLVNYTAIAAKVRQRVNLMGQGLLGSGYYLQQGRGAATVFRFELALQGAGPPNLVQQVCDGTQLWLYEQAGDRRSLARVDLTRMRNALPRSSTVPSEDAWLRLGGLLKLVAGLEDSFQFGAVTKSQLDKLPVWTAQGQWKPAALARLLPDQKDRIEQGGTPELPPNMPDRVVVHVGCDDSFPYRFEFWRGGSAEKNATDADRGRLLVLMELYEVRLGSPVDPRHFVFQPPEVDADDQTQLYLDKLGLEEGGGTTGTAPAPARR